MEELQKIESLAVSEAWKEKFRIIAEAKPISFGLNPKFENEATYKKASLMTKFNLWAFLFGIFYYIFKGMWKKGLVILLMGIGVMAIVEALLGDKIAGSLSFGIAGIYGALANLDYYRKMVLDEDFWL